MADFRNEFSWSFSRHGVFQECRRKYWLNHYAFWNGWSRGIDARTRELYIQKKLTTRPMWLGNKVHDAAERAIKTFQDSRYLGPDELVDRAIQEAKMDIQFSRNGRYRENPKRYPGFQEHYYKEEGAEESWDGVLNEIERQIRVLYENPIFRRILQVPERIRQVEVLNQADLGGVPVFVKLDVLMDDGKGGLVIVDWKTGRSHVDETVHDQLGVYALYARKILGIQSLKAVHVDLRGNQFSTFTVDEEQIQRSESFVQDSAASMLEKLRLPEENQGDEADFDMLPEGSRSCNRCSFRKDCDRGG